MWLFRREKAIFSRMITCLFDELPHVYQYQDNFLSVTAVLFGKSFIEGIKYSFSFWNRWLLEVHRSRKYTLLRMIKELTCTAPGSLIKHQLISGSNLEKILAFILEAFGNPVGSKVMWTALYSL